MISTVVDRVQENIVAAMRRLPKPRWRSADLTEGWEEQEHPCLNFFAEEYADFIVDLSETNYSGDAKAVATVSRQGAALLDTLQRNHLGMLNRSLLTPPAQSHSIYRRSPTIGEMEFWLGRLVQAAKECSEKAKRGRKPNSNRSFEVALLAASHFRSLTGKNPSRTNDSADGKTKLSGAYIDFLGEVYEAVGIAGSVDNNAKMALRALKRRDNLILSGSKAAVEKMTFETSILKP